LIPTTPISTLDFPNLTTHDKIHIPLDINLWNPKIDLFGGSRNGLLWISNGVSEIALWNPNIRKQQFFPYFPIPRHDMWWSVVLCYLRFSKRRV